MTIPPKDHNRRRLSLAYSPCPNDTYIYHGIVAGLVRLHDTDFQIALDDVEALNRAAFAGTFDITKLSFHAYLLVRQRYALLSSDGAFGFGRACLRSHYKVIEVIPSDRDGSFFPQAEMLSDVAIETNDR